MNFPAIKKTFPSDTEIANARQSGRALSALLSKNTEISKLVFHNDKGEISTLDIPASALRLLLEILAEIGQGNAVAVTPIHSEITTQEAANILNVSRPFLIQLLEKGEIPFYKVGSHRRVKYLDVINYKEHIDTERREALAQLTAQAQELDMGY